MLQGVLNGLDVGMRVGDISGNEPALHGSIAQGLSNGDDLLVVQSPVHKLRLQIDPPSGAMSGWPFSIIEVRVGTVSPCTTCALQP